MSLFNCKVSCYVIGTPINGNNLRWTYLRNL